MCIFVTDCRCLILWASVTKNTWQATWKEIFLICWQKLQTYTNSRYSKCNLRVFSFCLFLSLFWMSILVSWNIFIRNYVGYVLESKEKHFWFKMSQFVKFSFFFQVKFSGLAQGVLAPIHSLKRDGLAAHLEVDKFLKISPLFQTIFVLSYEP